MCVLAELAAAASPLLLDVHRDPHHHRSVFTLAGEADPLAAAARHLAEATVARLELTGHEGVHPRLGVLDVVPFTPYLPDRPPPTDLRAAVALRDDFARWLSRDLGVPSFLYGPLPGGADRTLPQLRRDAFATHGPRFRSAAPPSHGRSHGRGRPAGPGGLQRLGLPGRRGPAGGPSDQGAPRPGARTRAWGTGPRCRAT